VSEAEQRRIVQLWLLKTRREGGDNNYGEIITKFTAYLKQLLCYDLVIECREELIRRNTPQQKTKTDKV